MRGPPPHQLSGPSTLEYRPPPRRAYTGPGHAAVIGTMDESGLGLLTPYISHVSYAIIVYLSELKGCCCCCGSPAALLFSSSDVSYPGLGSLLPPPGCPRDPVL